MPDMHFPYTHPRALEFLKDTYEIYQCGSVVSVGDLIDFHYSSRHVTEYDAMNAKKEYEMAMNNVRELIDIFPEGVMVEGNHDRIIKRQLASMGIGGYVLKDDSILYGLGDGWDVKEHYHIIKFDDSDEDVLVEHGIGSGGMYGAINTAIAKRCSFVQGHTHSYASVNYRANHETTIFGLNVGSLADSKSLAQRYGRYMKYKGVLGCGVVYSPEQAIFVKMPEKEYD
jgi:UDP-2,3-diacylglucosamine pyrophosphatase LpxH